MDAWQHGKGGPTTMGFLTRDDIPFYYALADAYTVGDAYHCSVFGPTGPNRTYLWSGTINAGREHGSYVAYGASDDELGRFLPWQSYPETLQAAGVSWKVYQGSDNYGDNGAQYFAAVARLDPAQGGTAAPGDVYYDNGVAIVPAPTPACSTRRWSSSTTTRTTASSTTCRRRSPPRAPPASSTWRPRWRPCRCRSASASASRCCWSRRGPAAAG